MRIEGLFRSSTGRRKSGAERFNKSFCPVSTDSGARQRNRSLNAPLRGLFRRCFGRWAGWANWSIFAASLPQRGCAFQPAGCPPEACYPGTPVQVLLFSTSTRLCRSAQDGGGHSPGGAERPRRFVDPRVAAASGDNAGLEVAAPLGQSRRYGSPPLC
jgi:hypothetical protein